VSGVSIKDLFKHFIDPYARTSPFLLADQVVSIRRSRFGFCQTESVHSSRSWTCRRTRIEILEQAKRYAAGASIGPGNWNGLRVPFLYATNGEIIWHLDVRAEIHAFDLIIADECHRGYTLQETSLWRDTINHFDAVKIGLTATPAPHTTALFGPPVFRYDVEQAILDGYLVDYEAVAIKSDVRMNGAFLKEGEEVGLIDPATGKEHRDELEDERAFASEDIEKRITAPQSCSNTNGLMFRSWSVTRCRTAFPRRNSNASANTRPPRVTSMPSPGSSRKTSTRWTP
jgi:hypothetical protein